MTNHPADRLDDGVGLCHARSVPSGSIRYRHTMVPANFSVRLKANSRPGSATVTTDVLAHDGRLGLVRFLAVNRAPTTDPVAPSSHVHSRISGLKSGVRVTSETARRRRRA